MKKNKLTVIMFSAALLLAALGCWFLWRFPMEWMWGENQHCLFERQLTWNAIGIVFFAGAWALGWKRWLKAAPWLVVVWIGLLFMALMGRPINGAYRWVDIGPIRFNVQTLLWPIGALFAGWLCSHRRIKPWMVYTLIGCFFAFFISKIFGNANRVARLASFLGGADSSEARMYMQIQMRMAVEAAEWIGNAGRSLRYLPNPHTDSVVAGASLVLGKWAVACAVALMGVIASCLSCVRRQTTDPARRMYVLAFGFVLLLSAGWNYLQCLLLVPAFGCSFSWFGYGGTEALCAWLGLGIAAAAACGHDESKIAERRQWLPWAVWISVASVLISALLWAPVPARARFGEPMPNASDLGEFGTQPVRGTILAADGALLAKSIGEWQVHVDPQTVCYSSSVSTNDVIEAVSKGLGLSLAETRAIYENKKSRYVLARKRIDDEMLKWCQVGWNKRCYGLILEYVQRRNYPLGSDAAHVTGFCRGDCYDDKTLTGAAGLEYVCRNVLTGACGKVDFKQTLAENLRTGMPTNGGVVRTTIEIPIQRAMSTILNEAAKSNQVESAWAIAVRVPKGEIVAMSAYPSCDPNALEYSVADTKAMINGAVQALHEPGGLMKPLVYALGIDAGCVKPCEISDWSNGTFTNLCHNIGTNQMWQGFQKFRLGQKLGDGMLYGEQTGIAYQPRRWSPMMLECFGIGQGLAVTGMQLAQVYATLANGGVRVTPYLVESMQAADGKDVWTHTVKPEARLVSAEAADAVAKLMLNQTNDVAIIAGSPVPGKTSTFALVEEHREYEPTRYSTKDFDALYAGFFPAAKPEYAVIVGFRKPHPEHSAEKVALPVFKRIADRIMEK